MNWGKWYLETTEVDGFRLDAVKHIDANFYKNWIQKLREEDVRSFLEANIKMEIEQIEMLDDNALVPDDWREMNFTSFFSLIITLALN